MKRRFLPLCCVIGLIVPPRRGLSQPDSLIELLPLSVGNAWTYYYTTFLDERLLTTAYYDSGYATYTVNGEVVTEDSTLWSILEIRDIQHRRRFYFPPVWDTTYAVRDTTRFDLVELHKGRHPMYCNESSDDWKSVFPSVSSYGHPRWVRFGVEVSTDYDTLVVTDRICLQDFLHTFVFRKGRGITSLSSSTAPATYSRTTNHRLDNYRIRHVDERNIYQQLSQYRLMQNYPSPFNPSTMIEYLLPEAGWVTLNVYSVLGEEVAALVEGELAAGRFGTAWDASGFPSGVYFYS